MFLKKKKQEKQEKESVPKYVEAWGWAASAARFRGLLCVILGFSLLISLALSGLLYFSRDIVIVGVSPGGERAILEPVSQQVSFDVLVRHFLGFYANYSPSTIRANVENAMKLATKGFENSFNYVLGKSFIESIIKDNVIQSVAVSRVEISSVKENTLIAKAYATRYRSIGNETKHVVYELELVSGSITKSNPYGWYVNSIKESEL